MGAHARHAMHQNSLFSHLEGRGTLNKRAQLILEAFRFGGAMTDRSCMEYLQFQDMNAVRPRITELVKAGYLRECFCVIDPITHKRVRVCASVNEK